MRDPSVSREVRDRVAAIPWWVWAGLLLAFAVHLTFAWLPVERSFVLSVPDDAYYYFTIARNIAAGEGITADGLAPTNGFHPLWMALITPLWWIAGQSSPVLPVHLALTLGALLDILTVLGIVCLAASLTDKPWIAGVVVLGYAWNPYNLAAAVNGMETSLGAALFVWSLVTYWRMRELVRPTWMNWLLIGVLWSLLFLARTDYAFVIVFCFIDLLWRHPRSLRRAWGFAVGVLPVLPWLLWNLVSFGSISQVSGKAYPYFLHAIWESENHTFAEWVLRELRMAYNTFGGLVLLSGFSCGVILLLIAILAIVWMAFFSTKRGRDFTSEERVRLSGLVWPSVAVVVMFATHGLVRWMLVHWYYVPASIVLFLWFGVMLDRVARRDVSWSLALGVVCLGFQLLQGANVWREGGMWNNQRETVQEHMPLGMQLCERFGTIGISDSGYLGYYLPCRVVNLDGVVNNEAFAAIVEGRFREYLDEVGIEFASLNDRVRPVVEMNEGAVPETAPFAGSSTSD